VTLNYTDVTFDTREGGFEQASRRFFADNADHRNHTPVIWPSRVQLPGPPTIRHAPAITVNPVHTCVHQRAFSAAGP